jgi:hypothetical protein
MRRKLRSDVNGTFMKTKQNNPRRSMPMQRIKHPLADIIQAERAR